MTVTGARRARPKAPPWLGALLAFQLCEGGTRESYSNQRGPAEHAYSEYRHLDVVQGERQVS